MHASASIVEERFEWVSEFSLILMYSKFKKKHTILFQPIRNWIATKLFHQIGLQIVSIGPIEPLNQIEKFENINYEDEMLTVYVKML